MRARAERLRGMVCEARGDWDAANAIYDAILVKAPAHEGAHKRKIAVLRRVPRQACLRWEEALTLRKQQGPRAA